MIPTPCSLNNKPCILNNKPCILYPAPLTLHPTPYALPPKSKQVVFSLKPSARFPDRTGGTVCIVGLPSDNLSFHAFNVVGRKTISGSLIGGIRETQEMLDFCGANNISADISLIHPREINKAMHALSSNAAASERYVIDIKGLADEFEVEAEPAIDPTSWKVHASATIVPAEARAAVHAK